MIPPGAPVSVACRQVLQLPHAASSACLVLLAFIFTQVSPSYDNFLFDVLTWKLCTVRNQEPGQPGKLVTSTLEQGDERFESIFFL